MKKTTKTERRGITWTLTNVLEDRDFADDICLLSQSHNDMQQKSSDLIQMEVVLVSKPAHPRLRKCE